MKVSDTVVRIANTIGITFLVFAATIATRTSGESREPHSDTARGRVVKGYAQLPLSFEANQGQADDRINFLSRGRGYTLFLAPEKAVMSLRKLPKRLESDDEQKIDAPERTEKAVLEISFVGANPAPEIAGLEKLPGKVNYFVGSDSNKWRTNIPTFAKVKYQNVYPGVDLIYYGNQGHLEYDFIVTPGADPSNIKLGFDGADRLEIAENGDLVFHIAGSQIRQHKPVIYQTSNGNRQEISGGYVLNDGGQIRFEIGSYDRGKPLIIDPVLSYSTYLGGGALDQALGIAVDSSGNAYVAGRTDSVDFPVLGPIQAFNRGDADVFVAKLNPAGDTLLYATYLGSSGFDEAEGIAVDSFGSAYVTGFTDAGNFPIVNAIQPFFGGGLRDAFIAKLTPDGSALDYATFLGGSGFDAAFGIALDSSGGAYVTGSTSSANFPSVNPIQFSLNGSNDIFVAKINPSGSALVYSTYLGGSGFDGARGIAVDSSGDAYITGQTNSPDFPTADALQPAFAGGFSDVFVSKMNAKGSALVYSTYLGGNGSDTGEGIAVDASGNAYIVGRTNSTNFPTANSFQTALGGSNDAFVTKLNAQGSALVYSTYLGGLGNESGNAIAVDSLGNALVTGFTDSGNFPTANPFQPFHGGGFGDAFVTKLSTNGATLLYSSYLGGFGQDVGSGIAVDSVGNHYVAGETDSPNFPTANPVQLNCSPFSGFPTNCSLDAFVAKFTLNQNPIADAGQNQVVSAGNDCRATVVLNGTGSSDPDGDPLTLVWTGSFGQATGPSPTISLPLGPHVITLVVNDGNGGTALDTVTITVVDTTPPTIGTVSATPNVLSPPNHQMVPVAINAAAADACDPGVTCQIISVTSNEPIDGLGDGDTSPDWIITGNLTVNLRSERSGTGTGRIYTVTVRCTDASGNSSTKDMTVKVPR